MMKNKEKYWQRILEAIARGDGEDLTCQILMREVVGKGCGETCTECMICDGRIEEWMEEEAKESGMNRELHIGREYKHFKGKTYLTQRVVRNADDPEQLMIVYCDTRGDEWWVRSLDEFLSEVDHEKYPDVKQKWRFECAEDEDQE